METPFLDTERAAARLCLSPSSLERMRVRGDGPPFIKISAKRVVYARDDLDAWAMGRRFTSTSQYEAA